MLLLERNADVNLVNGEGKKARELCFVGSDTERLLLAAESNEIRRAELSLLQAAKSNDVDTLNTLVIFFLYFLQELR